MFWSWATWPILSPDRWEWREEDLIWGRPSRPVSGSYQHPQNQALQEAFLLKDLGLLGDSLDSMNGVWGVISLSQDGIS